ncbi:MAG: hypothetical protein R3Y63_04925 [Eubacteriales bacterium]
MKFATTTQPTLTAQRLGDLETLTANLHRQPPPQRGWEREWQKRGQHSPQRSERKNTGGEYPTAKPTATWGNVSPNAKRQLVATPGGATPEPVVATPGGATPRSQWWQPLGGANPSHRWQRVPQRGEGKTSGANSPKGKPSQRGATQPLAIGGNSPSASHSHSHAILCAKVTQTQWNHCVLYNFKLACYPPSLMVI